MHFLFPVPAVSRLLFSGTGQGSVGFSFHLWYCLEAHVIGKSLMSRSHAPQLSGRDNSSDAVPLRLPADSEHLQRRRGGSEMIKGKMHYYLDRIQAFLAWSVFGIISGLVVGAVASLFAHTLTWAAEFRGSHPQILFGLPLAGIAISFLYYHLGQKGDQGTNLVIESVRQKKEVPWYVWIRIFIATFLTHLFGGSAGREGAALQMGGSLSSILARLFPARKLDRNIVVMTGMAAAFSALFGTPLAAAVFAVEMITVGEICYSAVVPCSFAAVVGMMTARFFGVEAEVFEIPSVPDLEPHHLLIAILLAICCALISVGFCVAMKKSHQFFHKPFWNHYAAVFTAGCILVVLNLLVRTTDYMGTGMHVIENAIRGTVRPEAFLLKILFTCITLGSCYKGGEIVPAFFVGATFGCLFGQIIHFAPGLCAALGMVSVFCGVTNCPIASLMIAAELFGFSGIYYFLICISVSYALSGFYSLYSSQKFISDTKI